MLAERASRCAAAAHEVIARLRATRGDRSVWSSLVDRGREWVSSSDRYAMLPIPRWLQAYDTKHFPGDFTAALVVAVMLIPQSMAYAMLAGLPPQVGLYSSVLPLVLYACFGTSHALAVGPVAIVSLMVASALAPLAPPGSAHYVALALTLAVLSGLFLLLLGILRVGFLVNFLSHPVLAGFTTAAAFVIGLSQLKDLAGLSFASSTFVPAQLWTAVVSLPTANVLSLAIGLVSIMCLVWRNEVAASINARITLPPLVARELAKAMPLLIVLGSILLAWLIGARSRFGVATVGDIPMGLPSLTTPSFDLASVQSLIGPAILISLVGFLESLSVGKSLAAKRRRSIDPNQELIGLGAANIGAAFSGGYPVTGGLSRSVVNHSAGANTPLASIGTALVIALSLLVLTPLLFHLPRAVLAAIVIVAVWNLVDFSALRHAWSYDRIDGAGYLATFVSVLSFGVDVGIVVGIVVSLLLHLWRTSKPHIAIVGRLGDTEHFRNVLRHPVVTHDSLLLMRIDESLYFANAAFLEERVLAFVAEHDQVKHFVLICSAVNAIDASALETLSGLRQRLADMGIVMHLAEVKGPVTDRLLKTSFLDELAPGRVFLSTHEAVQALAIAPKASRRHEPVIFNRRHKVTS
jgi:SulP family sulfate permease